jgi:hypothetical protein
VTAAAQRIGATTTADPPRAATTGAPSTRPRGRPPGTAAPAGEPTRKVPAAGYAAPSARTDDEDGSQVADLVTTTVLAATELAHIGLDVGRAALRSMIDRLPKR